MVKKFSFKLLLIFTLILVSSLYKLSIIDSTTFNYWDESEYALISESLEGGKYSIMGEPFKLHPPFFTTLNAAAKTISKTGINSYRSVTVILSALTILGVYVLGEHTQKNAGIYASIVLSISPLFFRFSSLAVSDITLSFFVLLSFFSHKFSRKLEWLMIGSATLTKLSSMTTLWILTALDAINGNLKRNLKIYIPFFASYIFWKTYSTINAVRLGMTWGEAFGSYNWFAEGVGKVVPESARNGFWFYLKNLDAVMAYFTAIVVFAAIILWLKKDKENLTLLLGPLALLTLWSVKTPRYLLMFLPILTIPIGVAFSRVKGKWQVFPIALIVFSAANFPIADFDLNSPSYEWQKCGAYLKENTAGELVSTSPMELALYSERNVLWPKNHNLNEFKELEKKAKWIVLADRYRRDFKEIHDQVKAQNLEIIQDVPFKDIRSYERQ